jgi:hypothetical protein
MKRLLALVLLLVAAPALAQGDAKSCPAGTDPMALNPGQFVWMPAAAPDGPVLVVISLPQQRAYVFRNGVQIGAARVSTGRPGYETPTGVFRVLEKDVDHKSNLYDDAPMPFMLRLTWGGVALHAGYDPGRPQSHGCIRMPLAFARDLFSAVPLGAIVVVTDRTLETGLRVSPGLLTEGAAVVGSAAGDHWSPALAPTGPVTLVVSGRDRLLSVMRGGVEIGRTRITITGDAPLHTHALMLMAGAPADAPASGAWMLVDLPGDGALPPEAKDSHDVDRIRMPPEFARALGAILTPGAAMLISDLPLDVAGGGELQLFGAQQ